MRSINLPNKPPMTLNVPDFKNINPYLGREDNEALKKLKELLRQAQEIFAANAMELQMNPSAASTATLNHHQELLSSYAQLAFNLERQLKKKTISPRFSKKIQQLDEKIRAVLTASRNADHAPPPSSASSDKKKSLF